MKPRRRKTKLQLARSKAAKKGWETRRKRSGIVFFAENASNPDEKVITGEGQDTAWQNASEALRQKKRILEKFRYEVSLKESVDGKLIYLQFETPNSKQAIESLKSPNGFYYRVTAILETILIVNGKYKVIVPKKSEKHRAYKIIKTVKEDELNDEIAASVEEMVISANEIFPNAGKVMELTGLSWVIWDRSKRGKNVKRRKLHAS